MGSSSECEEIKEEEEIELNLGLSLGRRFGVDKGFIPCSCSQSWALRASVAEGRGFLWTMANGPWTVGLQAAEASSEVGNSTAEAEARRRAKADKIHGGLTVTVTHQTVSLWRGK
ncbi:Hypothetical predicted protein [Olea europaea subsp. europaea]|uniref:Ethylene-responsive binding factor-associated repression domain-containing protein n=1 Tax=Olea europaea subsp. europaea TaxID=158383 RepID=A0A8S0R381_OLEEU|nr:Hypothetical predicted protein [Olea europaea subsp. europaea]